MSYRKLIEESEAQQHEEECPPNKPPSSLWRAATVLVYTYTTISLTLICVLLLVQNHQGADPASAGTIPVQSYEIRTTHTRDQRYMTLDHKFDYLWNEWPAGSVVKIPEPGTDRDNIPAAISM